MDQHDLDEAGSTLVGFHCPQCGRVLPAATGRANPAPTCAGSKTRTGRRHEPTAMQPLFLR